MNLGCLIARIRLHLCVHITEYYNSFRPTISFCDTRGRLIQERSLNHIKGIEINNHTYIGLTGTADASEHKHTTLINGINYAQTAKYIFSYDAEKRLTARNYYHQNQLVNRITITNNPMGDQVIKKEYFEGGTLRQTVDFQYNIKGWLTKINDPDNFTGSGDYFAIQLLYNQKLHDSINCLPRYNGNISFIRWQTKKPDWLSDNELAGEKGYAFNYDKLNRLSGNTYYEYISGKLVKSNAYQEVINDYDKNGNIKGLKRQAKSFGSPITIDNLTYTYNGNQLTGVDDAIAKSYDYDFFDNGYYYYITRTPEYLYDANGNLTQDLNKEIVNISYNELNLPKVIDFKNNSRIEYQYDALGVKKRQLVTEGGKLVKTTDFMVNFVYENNYPVYNTFDDGRIIYRTNGTYFAETYIKDHLGNIRVAYGNEVAGDPQQYGIRQVNAYYPFGMNINPLTANKISKYKRNEFLYNGKMFQDELGLDWLDYGARFYDGVIGRWHSVDPMFNKHYDWSPYAYVLNNPTINIDIYGFTDWPAVIKGASTFALGLGSVIGGIAAACTPTGVGQLGGGLLITTGVPSMGLGIGIMAAGFKDNGTADQIPGGINEAMGMAVDKFNGNEDGTFRKTGAVLDLSTNFAAGVPKTVVEKVALGVLTIDTGLDIVGTNDNNTQTVSGNKIKSELPNSNTTQNTDKMPNTTSVSDNTKIVTAPVKKIDENIKVDKQFINDFFKLN